ncbi:HAD-IIIC family phosphatase [Evansella sp. AB-rgal1]|uniref:HAD-IIIC family phosphatase n=1 Tax=Evansella sp. AB-rgal1 TaxID=3242696 RepID=UPI00359EC14D
MINHEDSLKILKHIRKEKKFASSRETITGFIRTVGSPTEMEKIGHILRDVTVSDWNQERMDDIQEVKIAIVSNFTCYSITNYLRVLMLEKNLWPTFYVANFNQYQYELVNEFSELYQYQPDITLCILDENILLSELPIAWNTEDIKEVASRKLEEIRGLLTIYKEKCDGDILLNSIPMSPITYDSILDYKNKAKLSTEWRKFEIGLLELSHEFQQVIVIDPSIMIQKLPSAAVPDSRLYYYAQQNMNEAMMMEFAVETVKVLRAKKGLAKKCLILDLDNTLWGGIIGDDGVEGIKLGHDYPGNAFLDFQRKIKQLKEQGVLLVICSKNERSTVEEALLSHPNMELKKEDFVMIFANWEMKHENIKAAVRKLNIGMDSLVFIDDNPFERKMVRDHVGQVTVPEISEEPANYVRELLSPGWFNTLEITEEDKKRTVKYKQQEQRQLFREKVATMDDYLKGLDIEVTIIEPDPITLPRLTQLNLRTNQFNLTNRRYQQSQMESMMEKPEFILLGFQARDRFGDYGIVGSVILEKVIENKESTIWIRNVLMSCRVFSRGIETAILNEVIQVANSHSVKKIYGEYIPTNKNGYVKDLYQSHGFQTIDDNPSHLLYVHDLQEPLKEVPWITVKYKWKEAVN